MNVRELESIVEEVMRELEAAGALDGDAVRREDNDGGTDESGFGSGGALGRVKGEGAAGAGAWQRPGEHGGQFSQSGGRPGADSGATRARIHSYVTGGSPATEAWLSEFPAEIDRRRRESGKTGVFDSIDEAVEAAWTAQRELAAMSLEERGEIIRAIRTCALSNANDFARRTMHETGMGRVDHKELKFKIVALKTPGAEILRPECFTGDRGMTVDELAPFGVIGAVTPSTHPLPTLVNNAISFIAAGNAGVFNAHPASTEVFAYGVERFNRAIEGAGGPPNLITCIRRPTIETGKELFTHRGVRLLLVTGGPAVVREALGAPKRAICAGPGNPPVVVDETADLGRAAQGIIEGGGFDNNILCIGEKEVFVVDAVADRLMEAMEARGCHRLNEAQVAALTEAALAREKGRRRPVPRRDLIGRSAAKLAEAAGLSVGYDPPLLFGEVGFDHPFVQVEQMMPFMPIVRARNAEEAIRMAIEAEHGYGHTAVIHSLNIEHMHSMAKRVNTSLFVKNGASTASLAWGGEGYTSFSIATPTGEGCTNARTFSRVRRCTLVDYFRIV